MDNIPTWTVELLIGIIALLLSFVVYYYNKTKDVRVEAQEKGSIITELKNLKESVDKSTESLSDRMIVIESRAELRAENCVKHGERLTRAEQKVDSAHKRLDEHTVLFADIRRILAELSKDNK